VNLSAPRLEGPLSSCYVLPLMFAFDEAKTPVGLFFSVFPDPRTAAGIARLARDLRREYGLKGRPLPTSRFHCSLYGFRERDGSSPRLVAKVREAGALVTAAPFRLLFNGVKSFSGRAGHRPLVLVGDDGVVGLSLLHASLCAAMRQVGLKPRGCSSFTPHLTLLYDERCLGERPIESVWWTVSEIVLVLSLIGKTKHVSLGRWRLRG
jgi:RNA 2',3'-cyclic 3'-phosphodiesterase